MQIKIHRGYYSTARRYEFYFRVVKTIFYERAQGVRYSLRASSLGGGGTIEGKMERELATMSILNICIENFDAKC